MTWNVGPTELTNEVKSGGAGKLFYDFFVAGTPRSGLFMVFHGFSWFFMVFSVDV